MTRLVAITAGLMGVAGLAASAILAPGLPGEGGEGRSVAAAASITSGVPSPARLHAQSVPAGAAAVSPALSAPAPSYIATLSAATPYSATPAGPTAGTLAATNPFGTPEVVAIIGTPAQSGWLHVELPVRPNGSTGWIRSAGAELTETYYRVAVSVAARTITVTNAGRVVLTSSVAVGAPGTPTPPGNTYLWELIRPTDPNGAYGPYIFGLGWFSDAYAIFNGGDAQIGIHGQDEPWSIGHDVSHGCVRLPNNVINTLAGVLPLGTPVSIS